MVSDSLCAASAVKPSSTQSCNTAGCVWRAASFGVCSQRCTYSTNNVLPVQNRSVTCYNPNFDRREGNESLCTAAKPADVRTCNTAYCAWALDAWSACGRECGSGVQTRAVCCRDPYATGGGSECLSDIAVINLACGSPAPSRQQSCNIQQCYWTTGRFSNCSVPCGGGTQSRSVTCMNPNTLSPAANASSACLGIAKPLEVNDCNTVACAIPYWFAGPFSSCSVTCGDGVRIRPVSCVVGASATPVSDASQCSVALKPATSEPCGIPCDPCAPNAEPLVNCGAQGTCRPKVGAPLTAECKCLEGWSGATCNVDPSLRFTAPSVDGDTVISIGTTPAAVSTFSVNVTGTAKSVSLFLHKGSDCGRLWNPATTFCLPVAIVATSVPLIPTNAAEFASQASFQWTLPSASPTGPFVAGSDYYVRGYALGSTTDDSAFITLSECDSSPERSCLNGGSCDNGRCLCSAAYYGQRCSIPTDICARLQPCGANGTCITISSTNFSCNCSGGFTGRFCEIAPSCALRCQNDGRPNADCTACLCNSNPTTDASTPTLWSGSTCQTCSLQCENGGAPDAACTRCECLEGFSGELCTQEALNVRFRLTLPFTTVAGAEAARQFEEAVTADLSRSLGVPTEWFTLLNLTQGSVIVDMRISAPETAETVSEVHPNANLTTDQVTSLFVQLANTSRSDLYSGSVLRKLDESFG